RLTLRLPRPQGYVRHEERGDQRDRRQRERDHVGVVQGEGEPVADGVHRLVEERRKLGRQLRFRPGDLRRVQERIRVTRRTADRVLEGGGQVEFGELIGDRAWKSLRQDAA